ncbi:universal stress protein [Pseudanabaenaceae cyanobacterium LEGE 13415]|nr:universal stress protein [Pseudanabaenaceae cyanobacterium LEGE 13415]
MAPGVGKTYKMLEEAHRLKQLGTDVVIGFLETHDRLDTANKAIGLETVDLDEIIVRQPQLVLVDELAQHYQNIQSILVAGIDVYSTVNIQEFAHLRTAIEELTSIQSNGQLPESFLHQADEVVVVDVTPETLEERLLSGKIYPLDRIDETTRSIFLRSRLAALRELALREVADQIEELRETDQHCGCCIHERVLVCVSTHPNSLRLIRRGARLAACMNAPLYVLYVGNRSLSATESRYLATCDRLCQKFEGRFLQLSSDNPVEEIVKAATTHRITQIVLGQTHRSRLSTFFQGSLINQLVRSLKQVDLHIISTKE